MLDKYLDDQIESLRKNLLLMELKRNEAFEEGDEFWSFIKKNSEIEIDKDGVTVSIRSKFKNRKEIRERKIKSFKNEVENLVSDFEKGFSEIRFGETQIMEPEDWIGESDRCQFLPKRDFFQTGSKFLRNFQQHQVLEDP